MSSISKIILALVRFKIGVRKYEYFKFSNQKTTDLYFFAEDGLVKDCGFGIKKSDVGFNFLLSEECKIVKC